MFFIRSYFTRDTSTTHKGVIYQDGPTVQKFKPFSVTLFKYLYVTLFKYLYVTLFKYLYVA